MKEDCSDYTTLGEFVPESFTPKLKWTLTCSRKYDDMPHLARHITFVAHVLGNREVVVHAHPYSYGEFSADGFEWGFGHKANWLGTRDPEEALFLAEQAIELWARKRAGFFLSILDELSNK